MTRRRRTVRVWVIFFITTLKAVIRWKTEGRTQRILWEKFEIESLFKKSFMLFIPL